MNAGELLQRLWPRAPNHVLNIVVLKLSLLFTIQPESSDVRFRQLQSRRLNARSSESTYREFFTTRPAIQITHTQLLISGYSNESLVHYII